MEFVLLSSNEFVEIWENENLGNFKVVNKSSMEEFTHATEELANIQALAITNVANQLIVDKHNKKIKDLGGLNYSHQINPNSGISVYLNDKFLGAYSERLKHFDTFTHCGGVDDINEMVKYMRLLHPNADIHTYQKWVSTQYSYKVRLDRICKEEGQVTVYHKDGSTSKY